MTGIIIINYKTVELTVNFIQKELRKLSSPCRIVIVDVAGDEKSAQQIQAATGAIRILNPVTPPEKEAKTYLISTAENLGYAKGNNLGAQFFSDHFPEIDSFLFSNSDIEIIDSDVVDRLHTTLSLPGVGAVGPHVDGPFGRQGPGWKRKSIHKETMIHLFYPLTWPWFHKVHNERNRPASNGFCYSTVGCFLMVSKKAFEECGGFDPATFLYGEEDILAERLLQHGYHYYFLEDCRVIHQVGGVTRHFLSLSKNDQLRLESQIYYFRTYRNASTLELWAYRVSNQLFTRITEVLTHNLKQLLQQFFSNK